VPPQPIRDMRRLLRYRERLGAAKRRCATQAKAVLQRHGHILPREASVERWLTETVLTSLPSADRTILRSTLRYAATTAAEIMEIEAEIAQRATELPEVQLLLTITGVGLVTAGTIWAALGDPRRFASCKQVTRYAGLDASIMQSGEQHHQGHINKNGSRLLRTTLVEAALSLARHDTGALGEFYRRKTRTRGHSKAIVAVARKLLIVAWRMLLTGEVYRTMNPQATARKRRRVKSTASWLSTVTTAPTGHSVTTSPPKPRGATRCQAKTRTPGPA
jgi:transposase